MTINKNYLLFFLLFIYTVTGIYLSITTGISHDEYHEQLNWEINFAAIKSFFTNGDTNILLNYNDKYHGIGFHFVSQPLQVLLNNFVSNLNKVSVHGGFLISKHAVVFLLFSISGIFFYFLCLKISQNTNFSILAVFIYLLYPYFFGHAQINPKDMPFLSIWIISSYFYLTIIENLFLEKKDIKKVIILLSFLTAYLASIRISGLIIFVEFIIGLLILFNLKKIKLVDFLKKNLINFFIFLLLFLLFIYILNPIFWKNPLELFKSIQWMGKYYNDVCTITLGKCVKSLNLPSSYYFVWFFFKLPILIIVGFFLFPFVEKKIFKNNISAIYYGTFLFTFLTILFIFIVKNIAIYNEIRHIMFLLPMIIIISLVNIFYFNKILYYFVTTIVVIFFIFENYSTNPYQYTWLNSFAKFTNIQENFEIDYWGISNKNLQKKIIKYSDNNSIDKNTCIYGDIYVKEFLTKSNFTCFKNYSELDSAKLRPFFAYQNVSNVKRSEPKDCKLILNETFRYSFYNKNISAGTLWFCD